MSRAYWRARRTAGAPVRLGRRVARRILPTTARLLGFNVRAARFARGLDPDLVEAHDLNTLAGAIVLKRITGVPVLYDSHELFLERNLGTRSRSYDNLCWGPIERFGIRRCDAVCSVAQGICDHLAARYGIPTPHLVRNVQPYEPPAPRSHLLAEELGIPPEKKVVLYPGAVTFNRGLEAMIDSAAGLTDAVYVIMGYARDAAYLERLKDRARTRGVSGTRVFFREAVPIEDVLRYTASADLGIVPTQNVCLSYYFEASNKIFHCLMAGVPVVMSDHAEKRLLVERYGVGALFDETNPDDIARVVNETLADEGGYATLRENCLAAARELNWEHEEAMLRRLVQDIMRTPTPPVPAATPPDRAAVTTIRPRSRTQGAAL